ncbi:4'-phosphopantetheinyl transferase sfp [Labrenzia sp. THAF82]|uniref:4'-phosphopantetheinyl transferase family protein n=1 Tax=Labrenzia sp. THAF82 TaxID=2587861 RepID=UPI001268FFA7|nr:4'-phosphopantetheinyl transferase superfamily protein [Labrenzia sp. THAF82]QFT32228.1 4'-phosphopantetheinyl transferase sfp [Labrenzia sp. THAF82]
MKVSLYLCPVSPADEALLPLISTQLAVEERARADRFVAHDARRVFIVAHALLHHALGQLGFMAIKFALSDYGKPFLSGTSIRFSISHTEGLVAVAIAREIEIGVDVEFSRDLSDRERVAQAVFCQEEIWEMDASAEPLERFFQLWTAKEAVMKATGLGFSLPPKQISFAGHQPRLVSLPPSLGVPWEWWLESARIGNHWFALAAPSRVNGVNRIDLCPSDLIPR